MINLHSPFNTLKYQPESPISLISLNLPFLYHAKTKLSIWLAPRRCLTSFMSSDCAVVRANFEVEGAGLDDWEQRGHESRETKGL
jgi:hypothetical protein